MQRKALFAIALATGLISCALAYWPGLSGAFLLDDFPNLDRLNLLNANAPAGEFWRTVWMGQSGVLRRPVAMLTFALQHADWPGNPSAFKAVNLLLHLTCGVLIFWFAILLAQFRGDEPKTAYGIALVAALFWMFNPIHVSTTLYVVQRMTQLACFFTLLVTCAYLHGRRRAVNQDSSRSGLVLMALSVTFGTLLAALSKENGALLPGLILIIEFTLLSSRPKPVGWKAFSAIFLWLPLVILALLLAWQFPDMLKAYDYRPFSLTERLLTEPRVLLDYLGKIFLPRPNAYGLFFDDYPVSKTLFDPLSTIGSITALAVAAGSSIWLRKKFPWWSFAVLWFVFAHLLESTYLPLELYFEHRNYLPSVSLGLGVGALIAAAWQRASARHVRAILACVTLATLAGYGLITAMEVQLWGNPVRQIVVWAKMHPQSLRGQIVWGWLLASSGREEAAEAVYRKANANYPNEPFFMIKGLALRCASDKPRWPEEDELFAQLRSARYSKVVLLSTEDIVGKVESGQCRNIPSATWINALDILLENPEYVPSRPFFWFHRARLLAYDGQLDRALQSIDKALAQSPNLAYFTYPMFWLVSAQRTEEASKYLARARMLQESKAIDGILYKPVLDEWEQKIASLRKGQ